MLKADNTQTHGDAIPGAVARTRPSSSSRGVILVGLLVVSVIFLGLGLWSATAPLARAVPAIATLTLKGERKTIQHFEGGIIGALHVVEGQPVKKGQLLVSLDPLKATANVARHNVQLDQALAREARLESELAGFRTMNISGKLLERLNANTEIFEIVEAEQRHMNARRETLDGQIAILDQRIEQLDNEIKGLEIQRSARKEQYKIFENEIVGLRELNRKGYYPTTKLLAVDRAMAQLRGALGSDLAEIARANSAQKESYNQILSYKQRFRELIVKELRDVQIEISDLYESLLVARDVLQRIEIRAPRSGLVQALQFHTIGGVVKPGDALMEIVPQDDELIVNAQVLPNDIDNVEVGQTAEVRLTALSVRSTPSIYGVVVSISGDRMGDPRLNEAFFLARIEIPSDEQKKLDGVKLTAGMPADVLIKTGERTALDYILKPMTDAFARGLNED